ncbi:MAG TPA: lysylphosphatidylglycerol synthase transmembrane domain-containing protein [Candidatus Sulfotelmatobacter sp.]|nr:lysylphosphatidylglycerol synthase transmembrane domain-containing protein [Candidatus Sulfotelmatobacter sp.]
MKEKYRRIARILLQAIMMIALIGGLLWYVGIASLITTLSQLKLEYFAVSFLAYFGINVLFAFRLMRVLKRDNVKMSFGKTLLAQYAGMLTSDVTPGRSGYFLTPVYLRDQNVPTSKSLSGILGIQTIEFLAKVAGGVGAIIFLLQNVPSINWLQFGSFAGINLGLLIAGLGVALMLTGALVLAAFTWSKRAMLFFNRIANSRFLKRFTGGLMGKLEEYKESSQKTRRAIPEIVLITLACWLLKGFEWYFLGLALGITQIPWLGYFLIHPLVTALAFVPVTPAGIGVQEFGIIGIFSLIGVASVPAGVFALLSRVLLIVEDLIGVPQIAKSTSRLILSNKATKDEEKTQPTGL